MQKRLHATHQKLQAAVQSSNRCTSREQCPYEEVGSSPCGDPSNQITYSTVDVDNVRKIKQLAKRTRSLEEQINREGRKNGIPQMCAGSILLSPSCNYIKCVGIDEHKWGQLVIELSDNGIFSEEMND